MENLIDLQPLADVANNLIDKLGSAVGWIATHDTPFLISNRYSTDETDDPL